MSSFRTFSCLSLSRNSRSPFLVLPFLLSHRTRDTTAPSTRVAYVYVTLSPGPGRGASSNPCNLRPLFPLLTRVPSPQDSCYVRYDSPCAFSASRERGLSFSPLRLHFPFGIAHPPWTSGLPYTLNQGCVLFSGHANFTILTFVVHWFYKIPRILQLTTPRHERQKTTPKPRSLGRSVKKKISIQ